MVSDGARLAACASDGRVTLWLGDAPDVEPAASKTCGFANAKTEDVLFLSTNVMAVASSTGSSSSTPPESVALWDALQPARANPGVIRAHAGRALADPVRAKHRGAVQISFPCRPLRETRPA